MNRILDRLSEQLLKRVLPTDTASASTCCSGGGCAYEYRCSNDAEQRRYCCVNTGCSCTKTCTGWSKTGGC
jgi:hypothetical protein